MDSKKLKSHVMKCVTQTSRSNQGHSISASMVDVLKESLLFKQNEKTVWLVVMSNAFP